MPWMKVSPYMVPSGPQTFVTEEYVSTPPALIIVDTRGDIWTLGYEKGPAPEGELAFPILRNGWWTGEYGSRIEYHKGKIRIFTRDGFKNWTGQCFV